MLEAEMDEQIGYSKYDYRNKKRMITGMATVKKVTFSMGYIELEIFRDRKSEF